MTLATQLFFDDFARGHGDVTPRITPCSAGRSRPRTPRQEAAGPCPPLVSFVWGGNKQLEDFSGYLKSVIVNYTVFRKDGTPVQAKVDVTIEGQPEQIGPPEPDLARDQQPPRAHDDRGRHAPVHRLPELGKPGYWRAIAELNGIDDPLRLSAGTALLFPTLADAAKSA